MESLPSQLAATSLNSITPIQRPGFGTRGKKYTVRVNAFDVRAGNITAYQYDVKILPEADKLPTRLNRQIFSHLAKVIKAFGTTAVVYYGRALAFSPKKLPADVGEWSIDLPEDDGRPSPKGRHFRISLTFTKAIDLGRLGAFAQTGLAGRNAPDPSEVQSATQALNIAVQAFAFDQYPSKGASFYVPPSQEAVQRQTISKGVELWRGFYSSLRPGPQRIFLNLDITSCPMISRGNLADVLKRLGTSMARGRGPPPPPPALEVGKMDGRFRIHSERFVKGLKVALQLRSNEERPQTRKIKELHKLSASQSKFQLEDGKETNVAAYFAQHHRVKLQHPDWPCVRVSKTALWPLELCFVEIGQKFTKKLDPDQTAEALNFTTVVPKDRVPMLQNGLEKICPSNNMTLVQWGIKISPTLMEVPARELGPPTVNYKKALNPREGTWNLQGQVFLKPTKIDRWFVVVFEQERFFPVNEVQRSVAELVNSCRAVGMTISNPTPKIKFATREAFNDVTGFIRATAREFGFGPPPNTPQMIVCYLKDKPTPVYAAIKRLGDSHLGVATQCLHIPKARKGGPQYMANVALKMNVKLGGTNSVLGKADLSAITDKLTMVLGADVTHPAPGSLNPSVAAVVGTLDQSFATYGTRIELQDSRVEVIGKLDVMVESLVKQFVTKVKSRPQRIIFFRDGVSEGQFEKILSAGQRDQACLPENRQDVLARLSLERTITFIVCGKRHKMSFFPKDDKDADRKNGNVKAGMTVDTDITSPFQFDWYTQSHASLLGTGRSAHYTVLVDDSKLSADTLQAFVYHICYTYARCTRSVSYATPAYYADRVCTRAALLLQGDEGDSSTVASGHSGASEERLKGSILADWRARFKGIHALHAENLFFM